MLQHMESGRRFNRLVLVERAENYVSPSGKTTIHRWLCKCDCGKEVIVLSNHLIGVKVKSCGCLKSETDKSRKPHNKRHGLSGSIIYLAWQGMLNRCRNANHKDFKYYGAKGITVCDRWNIFENFVSDMCPRPPKMTLDRKDNSKGYSPENCRWATATEQARNKCRNYKKYEDV